MTAPRWRRESARRRGTDEAAPDASTSSAPEHPTSIASDRPASHPPEQTTSTASRRSTAVRSPARALGAGLLAPLAATPVPVEAPLAAVGLGVVVVGVLGVRHLGVLDRFRGPPERRAVDRAIDAPDACDADDVDAICEAMAALSEAARADEAGPPPVDPDRVREALHSLGRTDPDALAHAVQRLVPHCTHELAPVRVGVSFALAQVAELDPDRVRDRADAVEVLLADPDPVVRRNAVWYFRWLATADAPGLAAVAPAVLELGDDPDPDVRANVVTFATEFAHDAPAVALSATGLEATCRTLARDGALGREIRRDALMTADYVKSLRQDPEVRPADGADSAAASPPEPGGAVELPVAEVTDDAVRGGLAGLDVRVADPPAGLAPGDRLRVEVEAVRPDAAEVDATFVDEVAPDPPAGPS